MWYTHCELVHVNPHFTRTHNIPKHDGVRVHARLWQWQWQMSILHIGTRNSTSFFVEILESPVYGKQNERNKWQRNDEKPKKLLIYKITKKLHVQRQTWSACDSMEKIQRIFVYLFMYRCACVCAAIVGYRKSMKFRTRWIFGGGGGNDGDGRQMKSACVAGSNSARKLSTTFSIISFFFLILSFLIDSPYIWRTILVEFKTSLNLPFQNTFQMNSM